MSQQERDFNFFECEFTYTAMAQSGGGKGVRYHVTDLLVTLGAVANGRPDRKAQWLDQASEYPDEYRSARR